MQLDIVAFEKYYTMLKSLAPQVEAMQVYSSAQQLLWKSPDGELYSGDLQQLAQLEAPDASGTGSSDSAYRLLRFPLDGNDESQAASLVIVLSCSPSSNENSTRLAEQACSTFAEMFAHACRLQEEIDSLAGELSERYEELNLIYHAEDHTSDFATGQRALRNIVEQCIKYLDIDMALLVVPNRDICFSAMSADWNIEAGLERNRRLEESLLACMYAEPAAVVANDSSTARRLRLDIGTGNKVACSPVVVDGDQACGIFALLRGLEKPDFNNSQRNLLGVLERKIVKIIQQSYDKLTSLLNRASFQHILETLLDKDIGQRKNCLFMLGVNQLHVLNDLGGYKAGDALLVDIANLLRDRLSGCGAVARQSGDIFVALLEGCDTGAAELLARELQLSINSKDFCWGGEAFRINVNIGITPIEQGATAKTVINAGEHALAVAGEKGINRIEINDLSNEDTGVRRNRVAWVNRVNDALRNDRFDLHCQGIYSTACQSAPHHYEILIRMRDANGDYVAPGNFIPTAEYYRIMPEIDRWVIKKMLQILREEWSTLRHFPQSWAINLSGQTVSDPDFKAFVLAELSNAGVPADRLGFEVTETATVANLAGAQDLLHALKGVGCELYLDDFGTGLSSFNYLTSLPFDYLKIDGSFIQHITEDPVQEAMVVAIKNMAQVVGLKTVAEFVENREIIDCLEKIGIEYLQGYGLHAPEPVEAIIAGLKNNRVARAG